MTDEGAEDLVRYASAFPPGGRLALVAGSEGAGLTPEALAHADVALRIPMAPGVDSLNVATATGIALHRFFSAPGMAVLPGWGIMDRTDLNQSSTRRGPC